MNSVRKKIGSQIFRELNPHDVSHDFSEKIRWCIRSSPLKKESISTSEGNGSRKGLVCLPFSHLKKIGVSPQVDSSEFQDWCQSVQEQSKKYGSNTVMCHQKALHVEVNTGEFIKDILTDIATSEKFGVTDSVLFKYRPNDSCLVDEQAHQNIVMEYRFSNFTSNKEETISPKRSPNIAKPFHVGHLRSTIIGNVLSNMYEYLGHNVTRINYLGDWGTQFGYIGVGLNKYFNQEDFEISPISHYFDVYVKANYDSISDKTVHTKAMDFFNKMEQGSEEELSVWKKCLEASVQEYQKTYQRLGVVFDVYDGESMYKSKGLEVLKMLDTAGSLHTDSETGKKYVNVLKKISKKNKTIEYKASVLKSNGSTMYLTRDLAAAIDRVKKYNCDKMHYVVETGQQLHFENMHLILQKLGNIFFKKQSLEDLHIKFGRVQGMRSRTGDVVLLKEILDAAKEYMKETLLNTDTTKPEIVQNQDLFDSVCDNLAVSAIIIQDLKANRLKNYTIKYHKLVKYQGNTGLFLHYTHARLCSLVRQVCNVDRADEGEHIHALLQRCDTSLLVEPEALAVVQILASYDEALHYMYNELQPHHLVHYLLNLCRVTNKAFSCLYVMGSPQNIADARLLMFQCVRLVLVDGLKILSISPLEKM